MKTRSLIRLAVVLAGLVWTAGIVCATPAQNSSSTSTNAAAQTESQPSQNGAQRQSGKTGAWHHFGEPSGSTPTAQNGQGSMGPAAQDSSLPAGVRPAPVVRQPPASVSMSDLARQMWVLVDHDRRDPANAAETHGRAQPLRWNSKLAAVALAHSRDMAEHHYFDHNDRAGRNPFVRINATGIHWRALAENIAMNQTVSAAEDSFMDEPRFQDNHRGNILHSEYTDVGIGIAQAPNGDLYITQDFAAIPHASSSTGNH